MFILLALEKDLGNIGQGGNLGPFTGITSEGVAGFLLGNALSAIIGLMTVIGGLWFLFMLLTGALQWVGAGGDKNGLEQARQKITNGFIGLIIVVSALVITQLLGTFLGFEILNPAGFLKTIQFK